MFLGISEVQCSHRSGGGHVGFRVQGWNSGFFGASALEVG